MVRLKMSMANSFWFCYFWITLMTQYQKLLLWNPRACSMHVLINTLSTLDQHLIDISINTWLTVGCQLMECQVTHKHWSTLCGVSVKVSLLFTYCWLRCWLSIDQDVDQVSIKISIKCWLRVDQRYWWTLDQGYILRTPLILSPTGHKNLAVLTQWAYYLFWCKNGGKMALIPKSDQGPISRLCPQLTTNL